MNVDNDRAGAFKAVRRRIQETRDREAVEGFPVNELRRGELGGIEPAGLL